MFLNRGAVLLVLGTMVMGLALVGSLQPAAAQESVLFAGWSGEEEASKPFFQWMISSFNAANPDVEVRWLGWPWDQTQQQLVLRYQSRQAPDIAQIDVNWLYTFAALDALVDLNTVIGADRLAELMDPGLLALGQVNGRQLAIPWTTASIGLVANPKILEKAGVTSPPETVDEFVAALEAIKATQPDVIPYAISTKNNATISGDFQAWLWTFGGRIFDADGNVVVNSPATVQALRWLKDLLDRGLIARDVDRFDARTMFAQQRVGFYDDAILAKNVARANSGLGPAFDENIMPLARPVLQRGDTPRSVAWGHLLVVFKQPQPVTADSGAVRFLNYVVFEDLVPLEYFKSQGLLPTSRSALAADIVQQDEYSATWAQFTRTSTPNETSRWPNGAQMTNVIGEEVQAAILGLKTPEQAARDMASRLQALVDEVR